MAARNRSCQRDFNRRRSLILTKGFEMVFYQRGTNLSKCLFQTMPKEEKLKETKMELLSKYRKKSLNSSYLQQRLFLEDRWRTSIEPSILMQRPPSRYTSPDVHVPRYRRPLTCGSVRSTEVDSLVLARPCMRNKFNLWEGSVADVKSKQESLLSQDEELPQEPSLKERSVHFEPAISRGGPLSKGDQKELFNFWFHSRVSSGRDDKKRTDLIQWSCQSGRQSKDPRHPSHSLVPLPSDGPPTRETNARFSHSSGKGFFITQPEASDDGY